MARIVEVHVERGVAIVARSRPVVAVGNDTDIVDRSPVPTARSRQEDRTGLLQNAPLRSGNHIAVVATTVGVVQTVGAASPIIGQQDYAVHIVHLCRGIADA